jgi:hypothetical protein
MRRVALSGFEREEAPAACSVHNGHERGSTEEYISQGTMSIVLGSCQLGNGYRQWKR